MKPGDKAVDVVDRHLQPLPQRTAEWDHVRALEHDRANVGVLRDELVPRCEDVLARCGDVERHLSMCHDTPEFTSPFDADDRRVGSCTGGDEVLATQQSRREGQNADPFSRRLQPFDEWDLHQC
jgi:hypothetical protein